LREKKIKDRQTNRYTEKKIKDRQTDRYTDRYTEKKINTYR
jgi:hypothetical protein